MTLVEYSQDLVRSAGKKLSTGEVFGKILTSNDDSGRHGVLVPNDAHPFFPDFEIGDPEQNATITFPAYDTLNKTLGTLAYKYYERYPERRVTRLHPLINDRAHEPRLIVFLKAQHTDGTSGYYVDCANSGAGGRFAALFSMLFGDEVTASPGTFVTRPVDSGAFATDTNLGELLQKFDVVREQGWVNSLREGDTGIGYTFETLLGIEENNDRRADFKGIEIKCKAQKEGSGFAGGKINLFQHGPVWSVDQSAKARLRAIGKRLPDGRYACHSQVTTRVNNLGLLLALLEDEKKIDLRKRTEALGYWAYCTLEKRLAEKHSRAAIIKASARKKASITQFRYEDFLYCEMPSIERFITLVKNRNIVFEFLMNEKPNGEVRNHGYPWRLVREEFLDQLFSFQIKLR